VQARRRCAFAARRHLSLDTTLVDVNGFWEPLSFVVPALAQVSTVQSTGTGMLRGVCAHGVVACARSPGLVVPNCPPPPESLQVLTLWSTLG